MRLKLSGRKNIIKILVHLHRANAVLHVPTVDKTLPQAYARLPVYDNSISSLRISRVLKQCKIDR